MSTLRPVKESRQARVERAPTAGKAGARGGHAGLIAVLAVMAGAGCESLLVPDAPPAYVALAVGAEHGCALDTDGRIVCWGRGDEGALGTGGRVDRFVATPVADPDEGRPRYVSVTAAGRYTCALDEGGRTYCWGTAPRVVPGATRYVPTRVENAPAFVELSAGRGHACGLTDEGVAYCWGDGQYGQLGRGDRESSGEPAPVAGGIVFRSVTAGGAHSCGVAEGGEAYCWGENGERQLGGWYYIDRLVPEPVPGEHRYTELDAGFAHTCGLADTGYGYCWGSAAEGEIGDYAYAPDRPPQPTPAPVGGTVSDFPLTSIRAGHFVSCGVHGRGRGQALCWGNGAFGQLGNGRTGDQAGPQFVTLHPGPLHNSDALRFRVVDPSGLRHTCGLTQDGAVLCWGTGDRGQLGRDVGFAPFPGEVLRGP